jgi:microtubule-associated protein-like 1/2
MAVKAHPYCEEHGREVGKVTALWFDPWKQVLISSGDDGYIHMWDVNAWDPRRSRAQYAPLQSINFNLWVTPELVGTNVKMDDKEMEKANPKRGKPAAAHSLYGDQDGNLLVGTVCNEIYEMRFESSEPPFCYMQAHYEEMWGLAVHPSKLEFATAAEDATLRVWDLGRRQMRAMAKIEGPIRCACYSPDGLLIAVGLGAGGKAKSKTPNASEGKWLVLESEDLELKYEPLHTRHERVSDIKFSPDGRWIVVANADNFMDVYSVPGHGSSQKEFRKVAELKGHSSFINHVDWSCDSMKLQSNCGAHELLYWKLWDQTPGSDTSRWRPHQEKTSSTMRDEEWHTQSCIFGWALRGIWQEDADGTDVNACARSNTGERNLLATSDDFGKVKLFRYPCIVPRAAHRPYAGHSSHVTNVAFTNDDAWVLSTGGDDRAVFQWAVVKER